MSRFVLSPRADQDLDEIADYLADRSPAAARSEIAKLLQKFVLLGTQPLLGQAREDLRPSLRSFAAGRYVIFYRPLEDGVEVISVVHGARDIRGLFRDNE